MFKNLAKINEHSCTLQKNTWTRYMLHTCLCLMMTSLTQSNRLSDLIRSVSSSSINSIWYVLQWSSSTEKKTVILCKKCRENQQRRNMLQKGTEPDWGCVRDQHTCLCLVMTDWASVYSCSALAGLCCRRASEPCFRRTVSRSLTDISRVTTGLVLWVVYNILFSLYATFKERLQYVIYIQKTSTVTSEITQVFFIF